MASISPTSRPGYVYDSATDTWIPIGIGPHTHQATDLSGVVDDALIDAKGDLIVGSAADTPARLAVGNNGETLVADSSASTGLRWQGNFAAGKNKIINGDFRINQRGFTSITANDIYTFDRWATALSGGTVTYTPQTFTPGTAPVAGYEATNFLRIVTSGQASTNYAQIVQKIEDVRTFAGQTITLSFWAKAGSGTPAITTAAYQLFGAGGSSGVGTNTSTTNPTLTTSWARYSFKIAVPSISGKTVGGAANSLWIQIIVSDGGGASSTLNAVQNNTFDIWGVQVEAGDVATAFQTATGTLAGELAACQRYYVRFVSTGGANAWWGQGTASSATAPYFSAVLPVTMRTSPTVLDVSGLQIADALGNTATLSAAALASGLTNPRAAVITATGSGLTTGAFYWFRSVANTDYIGFGAEL